MSQTEAKVKNFEETMLLPALREVSQSPRLLRDYKALLVDAASAPGPETQELLGFLANLADARRQGPSLVLANRDRPAGIPLIAGRYVMAVFYDVRGNEVYAAPSVIFWMRFNQKLHAFHHRYDNDIPLHRVEDIKLTHIFNHILNSFDFYKLQAFSPQPFPGYR